MKQRTTLVVVALALVGIFGAWLLLRRGSDAERDAGGEAKAARGRVGPSGTSGSGAGSGSGSDDGDAASDGVRVVGRVVEADDSPVNGAVVSLRRHGSESGDALELVRTDPGGSFVVNDVAPGTYAVSATATGFLPGVVRSVEVKRGGAPIVVTLGQGGHRLHGTVHDVTGGTVEAAQVRAVPLSLLQTRELDGFGTIAGGDGAYEMFVAAGRYRVDVSHPDYGTQSRTIEVGEGTRAQDFALTPTGVIEGVVVRAGSREPVPHAWVSYNGEKRISVVPEEEMVVASGAGNVRADEAGKFVIRGLESGTVNVRARAKGLASHEPTVVALAIAEHAEIEVEVDEAFTVRGRVVVQGDPDTTVGGARVEVAGPGPGGATAVADASGAFAIEGVLPGPIMLAAAADGFLADFPGERVEVRGNVDDVVVELARGQSIVGRVEPPEAAEVTTELRAENFEMGGGPMRFALDSGASTEAKEDGTFTLAPVPAGKTTVVARTKDGREGEATVVVGEGAAPEVVIRLEERATVRGVVVSKKGEPVAEALVAMRKIRDDGKDFRLNINGRDVGAKTGSSTDEGVFVIGGLAQGQYEIVVTDRYGDPIAVTGGVAATKGRGSLTIASAGTVDVQVVVDAHDGVIEGIVLTGDGEPAADVWVSVTPAPRGEELPEPEEEQDGPQQTSEMRVVMTGDGVGAMPSRPPVLTGEDGTFEIRGLADVDHLVVAEQAGGSARVREVAKPNAKLKLQLAPLGGIKGTVTVDGQAAAGFVIVAQGPTARTERVRGSGTFELDRLDPGKYRVQAKSAEGSGDASVVVEPGSTADVTIALQRFITVKGRLVDKAGKPIAGIEAMVGEGEDGRVSISRDGSEPTNATDEEGRFEVECAAGKRVILFIEPGKPPRAMKFFTAELGQSPLDLGDVVEEELRGPGMQTEDVDAAG